MPKSPEQKMEIKTEVEYWVGFASLALTFFLIVGGMTENNPETIKLGLAFLLFSGGAGLKMWHDMDYLSAMREFPYDLTHPDLALLLVREGAKSMIGSL